MTQPAEPVNQCDPGPSIPDLVTHAMAELQIIRANLQPKGEPLPPMLLDLVNMAFFRLCETLHQVHRYASEKDVFDMRFHDCTLIFRNGAVIQSLKVTPDGDRFRKIQDLFFDLEEEQKRENQS